MARDFRFALGVLAAHCSRYGMPGVGSRLVAYVANNGIALEALCERQESRRKHRRALGTFLPVPGERIIGPQGMAWQIAPDAACDLFSWEVGTDSNKVDEFPVRFEPHIARIFRSKRTLLRMRQEMEKRKIVAKATIWDVGAILKFHMKDLLREMPRRFAAATIHSRVASRRTSDQYPLANEGYRPVCFVNRGAVTIRGVREDETIDGPIAFFDYVDGTVDLSPM